MSADLSEMVARAICLAEGRDPDLEDNNVADGVFLPNWTRFDQSARAALSIAKPIIRDEALEEAASAADHLNGWGSDCGKGGHAEHIAKTIRALKSKGQKP